MYIDVDTRYVCWILAERGRTQSQWLQRQCYRDQHNQQAAQYTLPFIWMDHPSIHTPNCVCGIRCYGATCRICSIVECWWRHQLLMGHRFSGETTIRLLAFALCSDYRHVARIVWARCDRWLSGLFVSNLFVRLKQKLCFFHSVCSFVRLFVAIHFAFSKYHWKRAHHIDICIFNIGTYSLRFYC